MTSRLTPTESHVLEVIATYIETHGHAPTMQDIAERCGTSKVTAFEHVNSLQAKGRLKRDRNQQRSIVLTGSPIDRARRCADSCRSHIAAGTLEDAHLKELSSLLALVA